MFPRKQSKLEYKGKKFTLQSFNVSETLAMRSRFRRAEKAGDEIDLMKLMVEALVIAIVSPKVTAKKIEGMSEDDLFDFFNAVTVANGFVPGEAKGKKKKS